MVRLLESVAVSCHMLGMLFSISKLASDTEAQLTGCGQGVKSSALDDGKIKRRK